MRAEGKVAFASGTPPQWVNDWLSRRRGPSQAAPAAGAAPKVFIAAAASGGEEPAASDPKAEARAAAQRERNRRDREAAILAGLDEFDLWLSDQWRRASLPSSPMRPARVDAWRSGWSMPRPPRSPLGSTACPRAFFPSLRPRVPLPPWWNWGSFT